jgi:carbon-monoxide dehydrogenase medium subunit
MKPPPFAYAAPRTVSETLALLHEHGADARVLAGGQSLVPALNQRLTRPAVIVDINRVDDLAQIESQDGYLTVGAMTRQATLERHDLIAGRAPLMAAAVPWIGWLQVRARGTLGGSLAQADRHAELPGVAVCMNARLVLWSTSGDRTVQASDFFLGGGDTAARPDELLVAIELPHETGETAFIEVCRRTSGVGIVSVSASVSRRADGSIQHARAVAVGVADRPIVVVDGLAGEPATEVVFRAAANDAAGLPEVDPYDDVHGSAPYRRHLLTILTRRALQEAIA